MIDFSDDNITLSKDSIDELAKVNYETTVARLNNIQKVVISEIESRHGEVFNDATYTNLLAINYCVICWYNSCSVMGAMVAYDATSALYNKSAVEHKFGEMMGPYLKSHIEGFSKNIDEETIEDVVIGFDIIWYKEFKDYFINKKAGEGNLLYDMGPEGASKRAETISSQAAKFLKKTINRNIDKEYQIKITDEDLEDYGHTVYGGLLEHVSSSSSGSPSSGCLVPIIMLLSSIFTILLIIFLIPL